MQDEALIIFVKNLIPGKTKTRLAQTMGEEKALRIYRYLIQHTHNISYSLPVDKFLYYSDFIMEGDVWQPETYHKGVQTGPDLGARMENAFRALMREGYRRMTIIGSDCLEIDEELLREAFERLRGCAVVAGPAVDGGYYLLGMNMEKIGDPDAMLKRIFSGKTWSSSGVLADTLADLRAFDADYQLLPRLNDIDEEKDLDPFPALLNC